MILLTTTTTTPSLAHADIISFVGVLATALISIYIFRQSSRKDIEEKRYFTLIFPLFDILEPHLYREKDDDAFAAALDLIRKHRDIAGNDLWLVYSICDILQTQKHFIELCSVVDREMDRCCRILKIKPRSHSYRMAKNQYKAKHMLYIRIVAHCVFFLVVAVVYLCLLIFITTIANNLLYR